MGFCMCMCFVVFFLLLLFDVSLLVWCVGGFLYGVVVFVAFMGYVLPCTQMSYWGLTVFSNVVSVVPFFGLVLCYWLWGCEYIQDFTLVKCHAFHVILPLLLLGFVVFHFFCLHYFLSSDGFCERFVFCYERVLFVLWFYFRDLGFCVCLLCGYGYCVFCYWYFVFHEESFCVVEVLRTSDKVIPEWFFLVFFGFIKCIPDKFCGVVVLGFCGVFVFLFCLCCVLWFVYLRCVLLLFVFGWLLGFLLVLVGFLSLCVVLCFPIMFELQFVVLLFGGVWLCGL